MKNSFYNLALLCVKLCTYYHSFYLFCPFDTFSLIKARAKVKKNNINESKKGKNLDVYIKVKVKKLKMKGEKCFIF